MSRIAWRFDGYDWLINPSTDSGWTTEPTYAEVLPIAAGLSKIQYGGTKLARRSVTGTIVGRVNGDFKGRVETWMLNRTISTLIDHTLNSRRCLISKATFNTVTDMTSLRLGKQSWTYNIEFLAQE